MTNTKTRSRRKFTAEFKAKVAMEALQEKLTLSELSKKYEVHPNLITKWKNQLKEQSTSVFKERGEATDDAKDKLIEQLYKTIGSLTMDVEFLKKSCRYEQGRTEVDGFQGGEAEHPPTVRAARPVPHLNVLHPVGGDCGEPGGHAPSGQAIRHHAVLRPAPPSGVARGEGTPVEHQASAETDGASPLEDTVPRTPHDGRRQEGIQVPVPAERPWHRPPQPSLGA